MNTEQLVKDTFEFQEKYWKDKPSHDDINGVQAYRDWSDDNYMTITLESRTGGKVLYNTNIRGEMSDDELAIAYLILSIAKQKLKDAPVVIRDKPEAVELTLQDVADLKGIDVSLLKIVEQ